MEEEKKIVRIGKYMRCSTDKQELTLQNDELSKFISRLKEDNPNNEYVIMDYADEGVSGKNLNRPSFQKLISDIEKKKINIVIFTKLDRLSRSLQDLLNTTTIFQNNGVNFICTQQSIDTSTAQGRLLFHIIGAFAEFERTLIKERTLSGREKANVKGTKSGKPCHRPKKTIDEDGVMMKYKEHKMSMTQIAKFYGVSITPIRRILTERSISQE